MRCLAEMTGTMTKKGDLDVKKALTQIESVLPAEMRDQAKKTLEACKDVCK